MGKYSTLGHGKKEEKQCQIFQAVGEWLLLLNDVGVLTPTEILG